MRKILEALPSILRLNHTPCDIGRDHEAFFLLIDAFGGSTGILRYFCLLLNI